MEIARNKERLLSISDRNYTRSESGRSGNVLFHLLELFPGYLTLRITLPQYLERSPGIIPGRTGRASASPQKGENEQGQKEEPGKHHPTAAEPHVIWIHIVLLHRDETADTPDYA